MPELSRFQGMIIKMLFLDSNKHNKPHVHVYYGEYEASIGIDGELLSGSLPLKKLKLVQAWLILHEEELYKAWNNAIRGITFTPIKPLVKEENSMYVVKDIAYVNEKQDNIKVVRLKVIADLCLLLTFSNGEMRIYDATELLKYPVYKKLKDFSLFKQAYIENGVVMWENGAIDVSPEELYHNSFAYETTIAN